MEAFLFFCKVPRWLHGLSNFVCLWNLLEAWQQGQSMSANIFVSVPDIPCIIEFYDIHAFWCFSNLFKLSDVSERRRRSVGVHFLFVNKFAWCVVQFLNTLLRGVVTLSVCQVWLLCAELCSTYFGQWATVLLFLWWWDVYRVLLTV